MKRTSMSPATSLKTRNYLLSASSKRIRTLSILARRLLKRSSFTSVEDLKTHTLQFIDYFNSVLAKPSGGPTQAAHFGPEIMDRYFCRAHLVN